MTSGPRPITCSVCGRNASAGGESAGQSAGSESSGSATTGSVMTDSAPMSPPAGWMSEVDPDRGTVWVCVDCVRENLRSVEARLDQAWW